MKDRLEELKKINRYKNPNCNPCCLSHQKVNGLIDLCEHIIKPHFSILETGTAWGVSTEVFAHYCNSITTIDLADDVFSDYTENGITVGREKLKTYTNVTTISKANSLELEKYITEQFDFIYLDALHTEDFVTMELTKALKYLKPGSYIGGHDYCPADCIGVVNAVNKVLNFPDMVFSDSSWIKKIE